MHWVYRGYDWLSFGCRDFDWLTLSWGGSVGIFIICRDFDQLKASREGVAKKENWTVILGHILPNIALID